MHPLKANTRHTHNTSMAPGKVFPKRLFDAVKMSLRTVLTSPESSDKSFFRRFLEVRSVYGHSDIPSLPARDKLRDKFKGIGTVDLNVNHPTAPDASRIFINDARKTLRTLQMEKVKAKLRDIPHTSISYSHYFGICLQHCDYNQRQATEFAETLDHSGNVIVSGDVVFLRPEQVGLFKSKQLFFIVE